MNSNQLDDARTLWLTEKRIYQDYGAKLENELREIFKTASISVALSNRVKKDNSLLKKMLLKDTVYQEINDKVGVRAIVHFKSDLSLSDALIQDVFGYRIIKRENKMETSDDKTFGYLSIHYDIADSISLDKRLVCELQLRTICQNAWSELAHILSYKPEFEIPFDIKREVNALSALMEIADNQFQIIFDMINKLPVSNPTRILRVLGEFFYLHIAAWYDSEMSYHFLNDVSSLYNSSEDIISILEDFIKKNGDDIASIATKRQDILFFSQPEIVLILERLESKRFLLVKYWASKYPIEQLEAIANAWGNSLY